MRTGLGRGGHLEAYNSNTRKFVRVSQRMGDWYHCPNCSRATAACSDVVTLCPTSNMGADLAEKGRCKYFL